MTSSQFHSPSESMLELTPSASAPERLRRSHNLGLKHCRQDRPPLRTVDPGPQHKVQGRGRRRYTAA